MSYIEHLIRRLGDMLAFVGGAFLILMMLQIVLDVILKYVFNTPIEGSLEVVSRYYMVGVVFLSLAMVENRHEHIAVDVIIQFLSRRAASFLYVAVSLLTVGFFAIFTYQTFIDAVRSTRIGEQMMGSVFVVIWPSKWFLPVGLAAISLALLFHIVVALRNPDTFDPSPVQDDYKQ